MAERKAARGQIENIAAFLRALQGEMDKLTRRLISQSRVIAKGKRIRDVQRLVDTYGGQQSKWVKKSSPRIEIGGYQYEYHWYEHPGIGRVEVKRKQVNDI